MILNFHDFSVKLREGSCLRPDAPNPTLGVYLAI